MTAAILDNDTRNTTIESDGGREVAVPLAGATEGRLIVTGGVARLTLQTDNAMPDLLVARFERPVPRVRAEGGTVEVHYPRPPLLAWLANWRDEPAFARLNATLPWRIALRGGVSKLTADLAGLSLTALEIEGGASDVALTLGRPSGTVPIRLDGGASNLTIRRPAGVPIRLRVEGGVTRLAFDATRIGAVGGPNRWESPGYAEATDRYEFSIGGGASGIDVLSTES